MSDAAPIDWDSPGQYAYGTPDAGFESEGGRSFVGGLVKHWGFWAVLIAFLAVVAWWTWGRRRKAKQV